MSEEEALAELRAGWTRVNEHDEGWWETTRVEIALLPETTDCPPEELDD